MPVTGFASCGLDFADGLFSGVIRNIGYCDSRAFFSQQQGGSFPDSRGASRHYRYLVFYSVHDYLLDCPDNSCLFNGCLSIKKQQRWDTLHCCCFIYILEIEASVTDRRFVFYSFLLI